MGQAGRVRRAGLPHTFRHTVMGRTARLVLVALASLSATAAHAASGNASSATGQTQASVAQPISIVNTGALRFGEIAQPATAGTVTLRPTGTVTATGGAAGNQQITQSGAGPTPGEFTLTAAPNTAFSLFGPASFTLSNGTRTMAVTVLTGNLQVIASGATSTTYRLRVGGTLNLGASQAVGTYSGSYTIFAVYQ